MSIYIQTPENKRLLLTGIALLLLLNFIVSSCGTARRGEPIMGKMIQRSHQSARGELVFMKNCQPCHPGGEAGLGPAINNMPLPGFAKKFRVRSRAFSLGLGRMPSFKKHEITKDELEDLVVYLSALKKNDDDAYGSKRGRKNFAKNE